MRVHPYKLSLLVLFTVITIVTKAQLLVGGGVSTFHVPADDFRVLGPTVKLEYVYPEGRRVLYWDASYFTKGIDAGSTSIYNSDGILVATPQTTYKYNYIYNQLGFKALFAGDFDERKLLPFIGGGVAVIFKQTKAIYAASPGIKSDPYRQTLFGFHFNAGVQYNIKPVVLELKGNFDIVLKPVSKDDVSNIVTNLKLCIYVPITK